MDLSPIAKYRHVYCNEPKRTNWLISLMLLAEETYQGFRVASTTGDQTYIKGNAKYFAFPAGGGGGPIMVRPLHTPGRMPNSLPVITGHKYSC